jgi:putative intracellular protease/amidase
MVPDMILDDLDPADSNLLILPGADMWDAGGGTAFAAALPGRRVPVAAICGATAGLVRAGLLDNRRHTSAAVGYLVATGYAGGDHYVNQRAVVDGISSPPARSRLCSSLVPRCGACAWHRIASSRRTREFSTGPTRPLTQRSGRPRRSMSVAHKDHHCSAA